MSGSASSQAKKYRVNPAFLLLMMNAVALSASAPPLTLPRGFLEQLPMLLEMPEEDYAKLLTTAEKNLPSTERAIVKDVDKQSNKKILITGNKKGEN